MRKVQEHLPCAVDEVRAGLGLELWGKGGGSACSIGRWIVETEQLVAHE